MWWPAGVLCVPSSWPRTKQGLWVGMGTPDACWQTPHPSWGALSLLHFFWLTNHPSWRCMKHVERNILVLTTVCPGLVQRHDWVNFLIGNYWLGGFYCCSKVTFSGYATNAFTLCRQKSENTFFGLITQIIWEEGKKKKKGFTSLWEYSAIGGEICQWRWKNYSWHT